MDIIRTEDVLKVQKYDIDGIKKVLKNGDYTYINEGQNRKTIIRNRDGKLEGMFVNNIDLIRAEVNSTIHEYTKGYSYIIVCPFLFHDWELCSK
jgi:hypothetical protein